MRKILLSLLSFAVAAAALFSFFVYSSFGTEYDPYPKAYNIYSNPVTRGTSGRFTSFMIDFYSEDTPDYTFWALANFGLFKSRETTKKYKSISGGGGYAGLQDGARSEYPDGTILRDENGKAIYGKIGIMSYWEMTYFDENGEKVIMTASAIYPHGDSAFGGEGEGSHVMWPYQWEDGKWYRMLLHTWEDAENGTTFMGQWFKNIETGEWTLHSYFDTHLINSCMDGGMGLFMENWSYSTREAVRTFRTKNIYVQDYKNGAWKSIPTCTMSYGDGGKTKVGGHDFGAEADYFWGTAGGVVEDQEAYDKASLSSKVFTIEQPEEPPFDPQTESLLRAEKTGSTLTVNWKIPKTDAPQLSYTVEILDKNGDTVAKTAQTRPEVRKATFENIDLPDEDYTCALTVTDVFGGERTYTCSDVASILEKNVGELPFGSADLILAIVKKADVLSFLETGK